MLSLPERAELARAVRRAVSEREDRAQIAASSTSAMGHGSGGGEAPLGVLGRERTFVAVVAVWPRGTRGRAGWWPAGDKKAQRGITFMCNLGVPWPRLLVGELPNAAAARTGEGGACCGTWSDEVWRA